jgi:hypothetical protein
VYALVLLQQLLPALAEVRILDDAVGRAHQHALRLVPCADAPGKEREAYLRRGALLQFAQFAVPERAP